MQDMKVIHFQDANSRETYFSIHNVKAAHQFSKGSQVKVGIIDHLFGAGNHPDLYAGVMDFKEDMESLFEVDGHGFWMATVLKEIAPDCEVYALNALFYDDEAPDRGEGTRVDGMVRAMDWAIENNLQILTYSSALVSSVNRPRLDVAVEKANAHGIVTTFIHYDHPLNLWPYGLCAIESRLFTRAPDLNIYHYDYNTLFLDQWVEFSSAKEYPGSGNDIPFFSFSSMSPVTAGFIAILLSLKGSLTAMEIKKILIETSYPYHYKGKARFEDAICPRVVDIGRAAALLAGTDSKV